MKISTSTSFVVASIALSSTALALPVPQTDPIPFARSPDLAASPHAPHSARVVQEAQMAAVARPGKGRPPAIRSGSGSRRSLPRRSKSMLKRGDESDKSLSDAVNGLLGSLEAGLAPLGLGLITPPAKEEVVEKEEAPHRALRFARQIPQDAPALSQPHVKARDEKVAASEQGEGYFPFELPGAAAGIPGVVQGEIPGFIPSFERPEFPGEPPFAVPNGQPPVPEGFRSIPSQAMGELQTGESSVPAGTVGEAAGQVPSELQNAVADTPTDGVLSDLPLSSVAGLTGQLVPGTDIGSLLKGLSPSQIEGLAAGFLGSTMGGVAGNVVPGGATNALGGMAGTVNGLTGSLPIIGGGMNPLGALGVLEGVPSNGKQENAGESASSSDQSTASTATSDTLDAAETTSESESSSSTATKETTTLPSTSTTDPSEPTSSSVSSTDGSSSDATSSSASGSDAEPTFVVNVGPDPASARSNHTLPVQPPAQSLASKAPVHSAPSPPIINVEAPSPTPSQVESSTETSSFSGDSSSSSTTDTSSSSAAESSSTSSASSSSTSSSSTAQSTSSSTVNPVERRRLLSRIMRHLRREDPPLPKGFAAPTGPIPNDTPPLLQPTVKYPDDKAAKDQAPATDADDATSSSVTSSTASESQTESSSESTVSHAESTSIATA